MSTHPKSYLPYTGLLRWFWKGSWFPDAHGASIYGEFNMRSHQTPPSVRCDIHNSPSGPSEKVKINRDPQMVTRCWKTFLKVNATNKNIHHLTSNNTIEMLPLEESPFTKKQQGLKIMSPKKNIKNRWMKIWWILHHRWTGDVKTPPPIHLHRRRYSLVVAALPATWPGRPGFQNWGGA